MRHEGAEGESPPSGSASRIGRHFFFFQVTECPRVRSFCGNSTLPSRIAMCGKMPGAHRLLHRFFEVVEGRAVITIQIHHDPLCSVALSHAPAWIGRSWIPPRIGSREPQARLMRLVRMDLPRTSGERVLACRLLSKRALRGQQQKTTTTTQLRRFTSPRGRQQKGNQSC